MSITVQLGLEVESKLKRISHQKGVGLEDFVAELIKNHVENSQTEEEELLEKIHQGISIEEWNKYRFLKEKRITGTLTKLEQETLVEIYNKIEEVNAERMLYLVQLSKLKNIPIRDLMKDLGIKTF